MKINTAKELKVYKTAYQLAMDIYNISKLTDVDGENSETATWLNFAKDCGYLSSADYIGLSNKCNEVGKMIGSMLKRPEPFLLLL
jgi:hypothetical protein